MIITVDNEITIQKPTDEVKQAIEQDLKVKNPTWVKNNYLGMWNGKTPEYLYFYEKDGDSYIVPFGYFKRLYNMARDAAWVNGIHEAETHSMPNTINLYDYQADVSIKIIETKKWHCRYASRLRQDTYST